MEVNVLGSQVIKGTHFKVSNIYKMWLLFFLTQRTPFRNRLFILFGDLSYNLKKEAKRPETQAITDEVTVKNHKLSKRHSRAQQCG